MTVIAGKLPLRMIKEATFMKMVRALPQVSEGQHFDKLAFRFGKKIFATFSPVNSVACIKLSPAAQSVYSLIDNNLIYPVPNKWGLQGWTNFNLMLISHELCRELLYSAYAEAQIKTKKL